MEICPSFMTFHPACLCILSPRPSRRTMSREPAVLKQVTVPYYNEKHQDADNQESLPKTNLFKVGLSTQNCYHMNNCLIRVK